MSMIRPGLALVLMIVVAAGIAEAAVLPVDLAVDPEVAESRRREAERRFHGEFPKARMLRHGESIVALYGAAFSSGDDPLASVEQFRREYVEMFGVSESELLPAGRTAGRRHVQPLSYRPETGDYKFSLVSYEQTKDGIPVFRSDLRLLVRNEPGHPLVKATIALQDLARYHVGELLLANLDRPEFVAARFDAARARVLEAHPTLTDLENPEVVIWAGVDGERVAPRVALQFRGHNFARGGARDEDWLFLADLESGTILHRETLILEGDVSGNVSGMATSGVGADICEPELETPMAHLRVESGGRTGFSDTHGDYFIPDGGATVGAIVRGQSFRVFNALGSETFESGPSTFDLLFNSTNSNEAVRAQVNAYIEANRVRDLAQRYNPAYPMLFGEVETNVNLTGGLCPGNAWYSSFDGTSPTGYSINFCLSGTNRPNTAFSSVVHHEYGHHLVRAAGSGQGQYGEGMGDVISLTVLDSPEIGRGFFNSCNSSLRNADNAFQYPCNGEVHLCGNLISGAVWDVRGKLVGSNPLDYQDVLANLVINSILLHSGSTITPQIAVDFLTLDDDDADLSNGTPHYDEINAGFSAHNMPGPPILFGMGVLPAGDIAITGEAGGPFTPTSVVYSVENFEEFDIVYKVVADRPWISVENGTGVLGPGASAPIAISLNAAANALQGGLHTGTVQFVNQTTRAGDRVVSIALEVDRVRYAGDSPLGIPPFQTVTSTINIVDPGCIGDLNVDLAIGFIGIGSLSVELESPGGKIVRLHAPGLDTSNNLVRSYDEQGGDAPDGPGLLADFLHDDVQGIWTLRMHSISLVNSGTLNSWSLDISQLGDICPPQLQPIDVEVPTAMTSQIALTAQSITGNPISFRIDTLPGNGMLEDPAAGVITAVPYTLAGSGNVVLYTPLNGYVGKDHFEFGANDPAPSLPARVNIQSGARQVLASFDLNTDPGWTTEGGWAFGPPGGGPDPSTAFTGTNIYGHVLGGNYADNIGREILTSGAVDASGMVGVEVSFQRWLGVETSVFDHAAFEVSNDGVHWATIWTNEPELLNESTWSEQTYDVALIADRQPSFFMRWIMGETDSSESFEGWNLDDIVVRGVPAPPTIELSVEPGGLSWTELPGALVYDVVRGSLSALRTSGGDFQAATDDCLGNNIGGNSLAYADDPAAPGEGIVFLVRGDSAGEIRTYDSFHRSQIDVRDAEVDAALGSCP